MRATLEFPFSYNIFGVHSRDDFVEACRHGYDTVFAVDHLGIASPFPALVAAAEAAQRLRVGTLVLNAPVLEPGAACPGSPGTPEAGPKGKVTNVTGVTSR